MCENLIYFLKLIMTSMSWKVNLINLTPRSLFKLFLLLNIEKFVCKQVLYWLYVKNVRNITFISNISNISKIKIMAVCTILEPIIKKKIIDRDNTIKIVLQVLDYGNIETVLIPNRKSHFTLCVSSQIGCMLNCSFCYTGKIKFKKNLKHCDIIYQMLVFKDVLKQLFKDKIITNIVFMGMGEPLLNIKNVLASIETFSDLNSLNVSRGKITVSSSGIIDNFVLLKKERVRLALSLHASSDLLRTKIMSVNKKYSISKILHACEIFIKKKYLTIEYVMLKDVNDSIICANELIVLLKSMKCKICLIPFNYFSSSRYTCSDKYRIIQFKKILNAGGFVTTIRKSMGVNIYGACGQLSGNI